MPRNDPDTIWWTPEPDPEPEETDWIDRDPGAVAVGEIATDIADAEGIGFMEAASAVFSQLPPDYRTPTRPEEPT